MAQTTYSLKPAVSILGQIADVGYDNVVVSASAAGAGGVYVGCLSYFGPDSLLAPNPGQIAEITDNAAALPGRFGVPIFDSSRMPYLAATGSKATYAQYDDVPVLVRGRIWVYTEVATAITDPVYVRVLTAASNVKGQFTNAVTANFLLLAATQAKWCSATSGAGLIQLELR